MTFYVLEDLTCDILFGENFLHPNDIFQKHQTALGTCDGDGFSDANTIFWHRKGERHLSRLLSGKQISASSSYVGLLEEPSQSKVSESESFSTGPTSLPLIRVPSRIAQIKSPALLFGERMPSL